MCLGMCRLFPKCQPKDTTLLFKYCFGYVLTTKILNSYFIYATRSKWQGELKIPSFQPLLNLTTTLCGCYPDGNNVMSASQRIPPQKSLQPWTGSLLGAGRWPGRSSPDAILWLLGMWGEHGHHRWECGRPGLQKTHIADIMSILALIANFCCQLAPNNYVVYKEARVFIKLL